MPVRCCRIYNFVFSFVFAMSGCIVSEWQIVLSARHLWLGSLVIRASNFSGREFDFWPPPYRSVGTGMGDHLQAGIPPRYITSHPGQLSLLPSVGPEMSNGGDALWRRIKGRLPSLQMLTARCFFALSGTVCQQPCETTGQSLNV